MELFINVTEMRIGDVRIYLRGTDAAVPKHTLDAANVSAIHEQVCSKTMTHCMWADVFCDTCEFCILADNTLDTAAC